MIALAHFPAGSRRNGYDNSWVVSRTEIPDANAAGFQFESWACAPEHCAGGDTGQHIRSRGKHIKAPAALNSFYFDDAVRYDVCRSQAHAATAALGVEFSTSSARVSDWVPQSCRRWQRVSKETRACSDAGQIDDSRERPATFFASTAPAHRSAHEERGNRSQGVSPAVVPAHLQRNTLNSAACPSVSAQVVVRNLLPPSEAAWRAA